MEFHERLKELREAKKVNQKQLSDILGVEPSKYNKWESGKNRPNFETVFMLARYFKTSTDYLLCFSDVAPVKDTIQNDMGKFLRKFFEMARSKAINKITVHDNLAEIQITFYKLLGLINEGAISEDVLNAWCTSVIEKYHGIKIDDFINKRRSRLSTQ